MSALPDDPEFPADHGSPTLLTVRPRRISIYAGVGSTLVIAVMVFVAFKLRTSDTGVIFRLSDAFAMVGLGVLFAAALMLVARPRLRVTAEGVGVRNVFSERFVAWPLIQRIAFPEGSVWAQLELADDEVMSVMAIQAMDKSRAVTSLREFRALYARYAPPAPERPPIQVFEALPDEPPRPLGRLEQIDRIKAAQTARPRWRRPTAD
jgi:hypothetical protein